jgi:glucosamine--fructose-6-phosphate aminotransferase (isomerizing)
MGYLEDILEQPTALTRTLEHFRHNGVAGPEFGQIASKLANGEITKVILSGMGGSFSARFPTLIRLNQRGITAFGVNAADLLHYRRNVLDERTLLILISQSGESVETLRLAEAWTNRGILVSVTNEMDNPLADMADHAVQFQAGVEVAVSTKTYTCTHLTLTLLASILIGDDFEQTVEQAQEAIAAVDAYMDGWVASSAGLLEALALDDNLILLGRGPSRASAINGALISKEATRIYAEGMDAAEYRHGPIEASGPKWPAILFIPNNSTSALMEHLATDILDHDNKAAIIGPQCADDRAFHVPIPALDSLISPIAEIIPIQMLNCRIAEQRSIIPGAFRYASKVTLAE